MFIVLPGLLAQPCLVGRYMVTCSKMESMRLLLPPSTICGKTYLAASSSGGTMKNTVRPLVGPFQVHRRSRTHLCLLRTSSTSSKPQAWYKTPPGERLRRGFCFNAKQWGACRVLFMQSNKHQASYNDQHSLKFRKNLIASICNTCFALA